MTGKKRSRHRYPVDKMNFTEEVTEEYQAEVDAHTARREKDYREATKRLAAAEDRRARIERESVSRATKKTHERRLAEAVAAVELRRAELEALRVQMTATPHASAQHRGRDSYRAVPINRGGQL